MLYQPFSYIEAPGILEYSLASSGEQHQMSRALELPFPFADGTDTKYLANRSRYAPKSVTANPVSVRKSESYSQRSAPFFFIAASAASILRGTFVPLS